MTRLAAAATLGLAAGIAWYVWPLKPNIVVLQLAFTPKAFGEVIHSWPPEHLARYRAHLPLDYLLLVSYGALGFLLATRSSLLESIAPALRRSASWWLPLAAAFDAVENAFHWWLTAAPRFGVPLPYALSAASAALKWSLLLAFGLLLVYALMKSEIRTR